MGDSATARAFGAEIRSGGGDNVLYYVVARAGRPDAAVRSVGGELIAELARPSEALALAPLAAHAVLRGHRDVKLAGPVSIDPERFQRFAQLIGAGSGPAAAPRTSTSHDSST